MHIRDEVRLGRPSIGVSAGGPRGHGGPSGGLPPLTQANLTLCSVKLGKPYATSAVPGSFISSCFAESYLMKPYNIHTHTASTYFVDYIEGVCTNLSVLFLEIVMKCWFLLPEVVFGWVAKHLKGAGSVWLPGKQNKPHLTRRVFHSRCYEHKRLCKFRLKTSLLARRWNIIHAAAV